MKKFYRPVTLAGVIALMSVVGSAFAHYEYRHYHGCDGHSMSGMMFDQVPMSQMQGMMRQNRQLMEQMVEEPDRQKRQQLMQQQMQYMHGQMMGRFADPQSDSTASPGPTSQQLEMMSRRLDRMQQMLEQMQQQSKN